MSHLSEYNPLTLISLPGVEINDPKGIIVVVGPNSSGKTLLLRDIENYLMTGKSGYIVLQALAVRPPKDWKGLVDELIARHYLQKVHTGDAYRLYVPLLKQRRQNTPDPYQPITLQDIEKASRNISKERNANFPDFFGRIGPVLVAPLALDERREVCDRAKSFNYRVESPQVPLQGLFVNSEAQESLAQETGKVFGNAAWLDSSEKDVLQMRVSGEPNRPPVGKMTNPLEACKYRVIETEGDGYRSYAGTCLSLLVGERPVCLIDEPELCLHPPQAYHIGRFIGQYASDIHATLVATHSSHVLRGLLEAGKKLTIIRLQKRQGRFQGHLVSQKEVIDAIRTPRPKAEAILDGVFSRGVVIVESEGDRELYQAAGEAIADYPAREPHFAAVGGAGGVADVCRFYRSLQIPTAVIVDLDAICDPGTFRSILQERGGPTEVVSQILQDVTEACRRIKELKPSISVEDAKSKLRDLATTDWDWDQEGDKKLRNELGMLSNTLKRLRGVKEGGLSAYADNTEIYSLLGSIIASCKKIGVFLVPVGELEGWVPELTCHISRSLSKLERAGIVAGIVRQAAERKGDVWAFVEEVLDYLRSEENRS